MRILSKRLTTVNIYNPEFMKIMRPSLHGMIRAIILAVTVLTSASCSKPSGIMRVWAVDDGEKIKQEEIDKEIVRRNRLQQKRKKN